jgi:uncharacterized membrane protein YesL
MQSAGRLIWEWLLEAYDSFWILVVFNILWALLTVLVIPAVPAAAGLYYATNQLAHQQPVNWRTFFEGIRTHFWLSWRWGLMNLAVLIVLAVNFRYYGSLPAAWAGWAQGLFLGLAGLWGLLQMYTFPLLLEQTDRRLRTAMRNSLVLLVRRPGLTLGLVFFLAGLIALSTLVFPPAWLLLTASLSAFLTNQSAIYLIENLAGQPSGETQ